MQSSVSPVVALRLISVSDQGRATAQHVPYGTSRLVLLCTKGMPESCTLSSKESGGSRARRSRNRGAPRACQAAPGNEVVAVTRKHHHTRGAWPPAHQQAADESERGTKPALFRHVHVGAELGVTVDVSSTTCGKINSKLLLHTVHLSS